MRIFGQNISIGITGTPATGKKSIGKELAKLTGLEYSSINELAMQLNIGEWKEDEYEVDTSLLRGKIKTRGKIVSGHLLPYVVPRKDLDYVIVMRCSPSILAKRYSQRSYTAEKISENLESELLDIIFSKAISVYGQSSVYEFDTTRFRNPKRAAKRILEMLEGKLPRHSGTVNWAESASRSPQRLKLSMQEHQGLKKRR
ncbi:MAG: adenylate kinase family protein [Nitrososphaerales archaeon]